MQQARYHICIGHISVGLINNSSSNELILPEAFEDFIRIGNDPPDVILKISDFPDPDGPATEAPVISRSGINKSDEAIAGLPAGFLWEVRKNPSGRGYLLTTWSRAADAFMPVGILFNPGVPELKIKVQHGGDACHPLGFPAGSLVTYLVSALTGGLLVHASAIEKSGKTYLFAGKSGTGKSTMARLWDEAGGRVIHDDRVLVSRHNDSWYVSSTPLYRGDRYMSRELTAIFLLQQSKENRTVPCNIASAFAELQVHAIQHHYDRRLIEGLVESLDALVSSVPVSRLAFRNDPSIVKYLD